MELLLGILTFILIFVTAAMIGLILIQRGKGGGLAGVFGGGGVEQAFGTRATTLAQKATAVLGATFIILSIVLGVLWQRHRMPASAVAPVAPVQTLPTEPPAQETAQ